MELSEFLDKENLSIRDFSRICQVSSHSIFVYKHKTRSPSLYTALKIYAATGGNVSLVELLSLDDLDDIKGLIEKLTKPTRLEIDLKDLKEAIEFSLGHVKKMG